MKKSANVHNIYSTCLLLFYLTAVGDAAMIQDHTGAAVLVGGSGYTGGARSSIYRLPNAGASWIQLNQKLQTGRFLHVAFLVQDSVATPSGMFSLV